MAKVGWLLPLGLALFLQLLHEPDVRLGFPFKKAEKSQSKQEVLQGEGFNRSTAYFRSNGIRCEAWVYTPSKHSAQKPPVIIMASGFGVQRDFKLPDFAEIFAKEGYAAFLFDFAHFGGSEGLPRQLVDPVEQLANYVHAVKYVQATDGLHGHVDPARIVLWGTSYSGGHALAAASQLGKNVSAVIAMEPDVGQGILANRTLQLKLAPKRKAVETSTQRSREPEDSGVAQLQGTLAGKMRTLRLLLVAAVDTIRGWTGLPPAYVPLVARASAVAEGLRKPLGWLRAPLSLGILPDADYDALMAGRPKEALGNWRNLVPARVIWRYKKRNPLVRPKSIRATVLLVAGRDDAMAPEWAVREAGRRIGDKASTITLDGTHVSLYRNPELMPVMLMFLESHFK